MRLSQMDLPPFPRDEIAAFIRQASSARGLPAAAADADEITDLAIHAAQQVRRVLLETCERAGSLSVELSSLHLAIGLTELDANAIRAAIEKGAGPHLTILQEGTTHGRGN